MRTQVIVFSLLMLINLACTKGDGTPFTDPSSVQNQNPVSEPEKSSEKQLLSFRFTGIVKDGITVDIPAEIDQTAKEIQAEMPSGTDITSLEPEVQISEKATYEPMGPQDFSRAIIYTVTAEDGTSLSYLVNIAVALSQKEILLKIAEVNPENTLEWNESDRINDWEEVILDVDGRVIVLDLTDRGLTLLPPEIGKLRGLQGLFLIKNHLFTLPPEIGLIDALSTLQLADNRLSRLPKEIGKLGNLQYLYLNQNILSSLPPEIGQLTKLIILQVSDNKLNELPPELAGLGDLRELGLSNNNLSSLPPELTQLSNLYQLYLSNNNLTALPPGLGKLENLRILDLFSNNLDVAGILPAFRDPLSTSCSSTLEELHLLGNVALTTLPGCICELDLVYGGVTDIDIVEEGGSAITCDFGGTGK